MMRNCCPFYWAYKMCKVWHPKMWNWTWPNEQFDNRWNIQWENWFPAQWQGSIQHFPFLECNNILLCWLIECTKLYEPDKRIECSFVNAQWTKNLLSLTTKTFLLFIKGSSVQFFQKCLYILQSLCPVWSLPKRMCFGNILGHDLNKKGRACWRINITAGVTIVRFGIQNNPLNTWQLWIIILREISKITWKNKSESNSKCSISDSEFTHKSFNWEEMSSW